MITDNFGNSLFVTKPGAVPSTAHQIRSIPPGFSAHSASKAKYVCIDCGKEFHSFKFSGRCNPKAEGVNSGFGSKSDVSKSKSGLHTWISYGDD